jgi:hypothetical protein
MMGFPASLETELIARGLIPPRTPAPIPRPVPPSRWELLIPGWIPTLANELLRTHPMRRGRLKRADVETVYVAALEQGVGPATGKRRVSVTVYCGNRSHAPDPDACLKSLLDALVKAHLLIDDSAAYCELGDIRVEKGKRATLVILEDVT